MVNPLRLCNQPARQNHNVYGLLTHINAAIVFLHVDGEQWLSTFSSIMATVTRFHVQKRNNPHWIQTALQLSLFNTFALIALYSDNEINLYQHVYFW